MSTDLSGEERRELQEEDIKRASRQYDVTLVYAAVLPHSSLTSLENALHHCHSLRILDIRQNKLEHLRGIEHVASTLTMLNASENVLTDITSVSSCLELERVFLEGNQLQTRESLLPLTKLSKLHVLTLYREVVISGNNSISNSNSSSATVRQVNRNKNCYGDNEKESTSNYSQACNMTITLDNPVCFYSEEETTKLSSHVCPTSANLIVDTQSKAVAKKSVFYRKLVKELFAHVQFVDGVSSVLPEIVDKESNLYALCKSGGKHQESEKNNIDDNVRGDTVKELVLESVARMNDWCTKSRTVTADKSELLEILTNAKVNV